MVQSDIDQSKVTAGLMSAGVDVTPEKLTMLKLKSHDQEQEARSEAGSLPQFGGRASLLRSGGGRRTSGAQSVVGGGSRLATRTSRVYQSGGSRRQSSFLANHRSRMSADLTAQAESKFTHLMELMTSASKEASSFREYWVNLMADRESFDREREELMLQIETLEIAVETKDEDFENRHRELGDSKGEVERLLAIINVSKNTTSESDKKLVERDLDLDRARKDHNTLQASFSSLQFQHDSRLSELESKNSQLRDREAERDSALHDVERHRVDHRNLARELADYKNKNEDLHTQLSAARKEIAHLNERTRSLEHERAEFLYEKDRLQDELKRANARHSETTRELQEVTDTYHTTQREVKTLRDQLRTVELERDEHVTVIDRLRTEIKDKTARLGHTETYVSDLNLRLEQSKREVTTINEQLSSVTIEVQTYKTQVDDKSDQLRLIYTERDNLRDDVEAERRKVVEHQRTITNLQDHNTRTDSTVTELRAEIVRVNDTVRETERSRDDGAHRHRALQQEIDSLKAQLERARAEHNDVAAARDNACRDFDELQGQWQETITEMETHEQSSHELEYEIESLRTLIKEVRADKERAVTARIAADKERDEANRAVDAKQREMAKLQEQNVQHLRSLESSKQSGNASSRVVSNTITRSGGYTSGMGSGHGHSHGGHGHSHGHSHEHHGNGEETTN